MSLVFDRTQIRWTKDEFERVLAIDHIRRHLIRQGLVRKKKRYLSEFSNNILLKK